MAGNDRRNDPRPALQAGTMTIGARIVVSEIIRLTKSFGFNGCKAHRCRHHGALYYNREKVEKESADAAKPRDKVETPEERSITECVRASEPYLAADTGRWKSR